MTANDSGGGVGGDLPTGVLIAASISAGLSTILSLATVWLQLKHYYKPRLQRLVVRILVMSVPACSCPAFVRAQADDGGNLGSRSTRSRPSSRCTRSIWPFSSTRSGTCTRCVSALNDLRAGLTSAGHLPAGIRHLVSFDPVANWHTYDLS